MAWLQRKRDSAAKALRIEAPSQPTIDLEYRGVHLGSLSGRLFRELADAQDDNSVRDVLAAMFETGVLCDRNGNKFAEFDFTRDFDDGRDVLELMRRIGDVSREVGKSAPAEATS